MTYDDWKATDTTPEPERSGWCAKCEHYECDCPCCTEPKRYYCDQCGAESGDIMVAAGYRGGPCECGGDVREPR